MTIKTTKNKYYILKGKTIANMGKILNAILKEYLEFKNNGIIIKKKKK